MNKDQERYELLARKQQQEWEALCTCCGACCGIVEGDPCEYLLKSDMGKYTCAIYENRFGLHKTTSGKEFKCVPIRDILHQSWMGDQYCGYKQGK